MRRRRKSNPISGFARAGKRTANRTLYLFGPVLLFAVILTAWYVGDRSSFDAMVTAVGKFFHALQGGS